MRRYLFVLTQIILLSTLVLSSCRQKVDSADPKGRETIDIVLAEAMQPVCSPVYIADQKGFFKEEGLNVKLVPFQKGKLCLDVVLGRKADLGTVAETPLMHVGFQKQPVAILCTMHYATKNTKCVARKDKGISKPEDLKGHAIGVPIGGNAEYFMDRFLQKYGLGRADVKVVNLNPPEMVGAIVRGDIDASFSWEPHVTSEVVPSIVEG
jgi:NitT/TauT family transport system substrate-binding protein